MFTCAVYVAHDLCGYSVRIFRPCAERSCYPQPSYLRWILTPVMLDSFYATKIGEIICDLHLLLFILIHSVHLYRMAQLFG